MGAITLRSQDEEHESGVFDRATARPAESEPLIPLSKSLAAPRVPRFDSNPLGGLLESPSGDWGIPPDPFGELQAPAAPAFDPSTLLRVIADVEDVKSSPLSAREGFVLGLLDGATSVEDLIDVAPMESDELLEILSALRSRRLIG